MQCVNLTLWLESQQELGPKFGAIIAMYFALLLIRIFKRSFQLSKGFLLLYWLKLF